MSDADHRIGGRDLRDPGLGLRAVEMIRELDEPESLALSRLMRPAIEIWRSIMLEHVTTGDFVLLARASDIEAAGLGDRLLGMELRPSSLLDDGEVVRAAPR